jgi:hypothetical protein
MGAASIHGDHIARDPIVPIASPVSIGLTDGRDDGMAGRWGEKIFFAPTVLIGLNHRWYDAATAIQTVVVYGYRMHRSFHNYGRRISVIKHLNV